MESTIKAKFDTIMRSMLALFQLFHLKFSIVKRRIGRASLVLRSSELNLFGKIVCLYLALSGQAWGNAERALKDLRNRTIAGILIFCIVLDPLGAILYADTSISNGMNAIDVIGQYDDSLTNPQPVYTKSGQNNGPNILGLSLTGTSDIAEDTTNHWLFISDSGNNRVLVYNLNSSNVLVDHAPDYVIGQPDFHSNTSATTQNGLVAALVGVEYDNVNHRLFVANGNRVTIYDLSSGITNGMNASYVLGQSSFTTNTSSGSQSGLATVSKMRYDPDNNLLYVSQGGIDRVMVFDVNPATITNGSNAVDALGHYDDNLSDPQPVYTKTLVNDGPNKLGLGTAASIQESLTIDPVGHLLFAVDPGNNRVLVYNLDTNNNLIDHIPDYVLGQPNFYTGTAVNTQSGFNTPRDVAYDSTNKYLFVSEASGNRIKVFDLSGGITNGMNATYVLGQAGFTTATAGNTQSGLNIPSGLVYDSARKYLFVSETTGNRVKVFDLSSGISTNMNASYVLGQSSFTVATAAITQSGFSAPRGIAYDPTNKYLFVAQSTANRVSVFDTTTLSNGMNAINVIGQSSFTVSTAATTQAGMSGPYAVAYDDTNKRLYVAQQGSRRVAMYNLSSGITDGMNASNVLGQTSFTASAASVTQTSTRDANGVYFDSSNGRLYVYESSNGRINIFDASGTITDNMSAVDLIGEYDDSLSDPQPVWTKGTINNAPNVLGMSNPTEVSLDRMHHRLFVADSANFRVLVFNLTSGNLLIDHIPDYVLGQPDFHTNVSTTNTAAGFTTVNDISYDDVNDRLFVTEGNRVKVFDLSSGITNGMNASYVLGQAGFTTNTAATTQSGLNGPVGSYIDTANKLLYVDETGNNRVMIFNVDPATIANGENASDEIGQYDDGASPQSIYTKSAVNNGPNTLGLTETADNSGGTAFDSVNHRLFVSDTGNHRVLVFNLDSNNNLVDHVPDYVLGQSNFYTGTALNTQSGLNGPDALVYNESDSLLFVAEAAGNRVKIFDLSSGITNGMNASYVLGQAGFTTGTAVNSQSGMNGVRGLAYDSVRKYLFVCEGTGNRVKIFDLSSGITNGMNASYVLGQAGFTTATAATTQSGLNVPRGIAYDPTNKYLFVTQSTANRVSVFDTTTLSNGMNAINVLGQSSFTTATAATTQSGFSFPAGAAYDDVNKLLYVGQATSKRVSVFDLSSGITDGMNASYVLGQSSFTAAVTAVTQAGITAVRDVSYDPYSGRLYVSDSSAHRIMVWQVANVTHAGVTVTPTSGLTTTESGGTATFTVALNSQPTSDVTINLSSSDTTEGTASPASLTFTNSTWNTPQTVTVTGVDDAIVDGDIGYTIVTSDTASADSSYNGLTVDDVSLTNTDNDTAGVTITPTSGLTTTEAGGTATFTVVLNSQPSSDVTLGLSSSDTTEGVVSPASLTFTNSNWDTPQTVTVTGVDDNVADGNIAYSIVTSNTSSADSNYNGLAVDDVSLANTDDDAVGVTVTPTSGLTTTESGGTATFTIVFNSQPTADVTIPISSSDTTEGTVSVSSLTFTDSNWNTPQTVTVTGVDDNVADGNIAYTVVTGPTSSVDSAYNNLTVSDVSVTNTDNDTAGITVTPTSGLTTTESGGAATFTVVLNSQPTADVSIDLASSDITEGTTSLLSLIFTNSNWNTPQTVTVTGVDDAIVDGDVAYSIVTSAASSTDSNYNGLAVDDVSLANTDNDIAPVTVVQVSGSASDVAPISGRGYAYLFPQPSVTQPNISISQPVVDLGISVGIYSSSTKNSAIKRPNIDSRLTEEIRKFGPTGQGLSLSKNNLPATLLVLLKPLDTKMGLNGDGASWALPGELNFFLNKFPSLEKTLADIGMTSMNSLRNIQGQTFVIPGINDIAYSDIKNIGSAQISSRLYLPDLGTLDLNSDLRLAKLANLPTQELFAQGAAGKIDLNMRLKITDSGDLERTLRGTVGQTIRLSIKPSGAGGEVSGIKGEIQLFPESVATSSFQSGDKKLLVESFAYNDKNKDGIYEAEIQAPIAGRYKINTLAYGKADKKEELNSVIMVIDPEGYVYTEQGEQELRIDNATVSIYWKNPITKDFELWPAKLYSQDNPQVTGKTGAYSFLVPEGEYYVQVEAKGYSSYKSKTYNVSYGTSIHDNIRLEKDSWWKKFLSWIF